MEKIVTYHYKFTLSNDIEIKFNIKLDNKTLNLIQTNKKSPPKWTNLNYFKCPNCSLDETKHKFCPIAINLIDIINCFKNYVSYKEVDVLIETKARKYMKHTTLQKGLSSLIGIYMVTSGCPIMEKLKPMVRYHLPFATTEETKYRVISMYLLAQYFLYKQGKKPDWELEKLVKIYTDIHIVNENLCKRIADIELEDSNINALVILNCFADSVTFSIDKNLLEEIESLFNAYFR